MMSMLCNCCVRELLILARTWFAFGLPSKTECDSCPPRTSRRNSPRPRSTLTHPSSRARRARRPGCKSIPPRRSPRSRLNHQTTPGERQEPESPRTRRRTPPPITPSCRSPPREESARACACRLSDAKSHHLSCSCPWRKWKEGEEMK
jgi:hypothetical protein